MKGEYEKLRGIKVEESISQKAIMLCKHFPGDAGKSSEQPKSWRTFKSWRTILLEEFLCDWGRTSSGLVPFPQCSSVCARSSPGRSSPQSAPILYMMRNTAGTSPRRFVLFFVRNSFTKGTWPVS